MKKYFAVLIALVPFNFVRLFLYRRLLGYRIARGAKIAPFTFIIAEQCEMGKVSIGFLNYISVNTLSLGDDVSIGRFNRLKWLVEVSMCEGTIFRSRNVAVGTIPGISPFKNHEILRIGAGCVITNQHSFDVSDEIVIGNDVTIAGSGTQMWTHGFDLQHRKIQAGIYIANRIYVGSRSLILQGVTICDDVVIGAGTTVTRSIGDSGFYVSSQLIRKGNVPDFQKSETVTDFNGYAFARRITLINDEIASNEK